MCRDSHTIDVRLTFEPCIAATTYDSIPVMFEKEKRIFREIADKLSADERILRAILFGSRVRGDFRGDSDFDVMVIVDQKTQELKHKIIDIFYSYELATDISFSLMIRSREEVEFNKKLGSPFFKNIEKEGVVFHDSGQGCVPTLQEKFAV